MTINDKLLEQILQFTASPFSPFYLYDTALLRQHCRMFHSIPYANKSIHFASMANANSEFLSIVREEKMEVFVNSRMHLEKVMEVGYRGENIIFTASALEDASMQMLHDKKVSLNLDSPEQLKTWKRLFPGAAVGLRCNIDDQAEGLSTHAGYFLGKESRLGFSMEELMAVSKDPIIRGLHLYVGTDIFDIRYFMACYRKLCEVSLEFPHLEFLNFGGGFGVAENGNRHLDFSAYRIEVAALMEEISEKHGKSLKLILEPGRIIGGQAGYFVCRVTDIKIRNGKTLIGVNASSSQFSRPLFYPDIARHPVALLRQGSILHADADAVTEASIYGCSTYSRDYLAKDVMLPEPRIGDVVILGNAGSYSASSYTQFLGFPQAEEFFV